jgi:subtilisin family serine protease
MKKISLILAACLLIFNCYAQHTENKYWITFTDKPNASTITQVSQQAVANRLQMQLPASQLTDQPVNPQYTSQLQQMGIQSISTSKWLNAISAYLSAEQVKQVSQLPFVQEVSPIDTHLQITAWSDPNFRPDYMATVLTQVGADEFVKQGISGKGIKIGVIDVGFYGAHTNRTLQHLMKEDRIKEVKDYVNPLKKEPFSELETHSDYHGAEVLQMITGFDNERKMQYGLATGADFYLARTDHGVKETRTEEDNWIMAIERMDSLGIRLVNTSLGYAVGFTNPKENYKPTDMNGRTSKISKAAQIAAEEKGILVVVSAGNEGDDQAWRIVSTPADTKGVVSVGATKAKSRDKMSYSSIGPDFLPYLKPNVSCFAASGTSFAAPVITGFAACLMEKKPKLTNKQLIHIIEKSAHLYPYGNNYVGYGVPNAHKALQLLEDSTLNLNQIKEIRVKGDLFTYTAALPTTERAVVFHKKSPTLVLKQELLILDGGKLELKKLANETHTTLDMGDEIVEVIWQKE